MNVKRLATCSSMIALLGTLYSPALLAQSADQTAQTEEKNASLDKADEETEVIVVNFTGTSIRGAAPVGSSLIELDRDAIDSSNSISTIDLLRETPQVFSLGVNDTSRNGSGGSGNIVYGNAINIRGIGPYATLTLINGRRAVPQGTLGATVDPSTIPTLGLQRVEVIADGASAVYGSDAVAGVANLILRRGFEGAQVTAQFGSGDSYDDRQLGIITGKTWDSGQVTVSAQHSYRSNIFGGDRDYYGSDLTARGGEDYRVTSCNPGNMIIGGETYAIPAGGATADNLVAGTLNQCDNLAVSTDLMPEREINSATITFDQDITDSIGFFADFLYSKREGQRYSEPYDGQIIVPETNPYFVAPTGVTLDPCPSSAGGSDLDCVTIDYSFIGEYGQSAITTFTTDTWQATAGFDILLPADWLLNVYATKGRNKDRAFSRGNNVNSSNLRAALASSDTATAFNPFGTSANSQSVLDSIFDYATDTVGETKITDAGIKVDGPLMSLPGGDLKMAAGLNYYDMELWTGQVRGADGAREYNFAPRNRDVKSAFAELYVPIIGDGNAMTGIHSLTLSLAGRIDEYSDVGRTENPKIGLDWQPTENLAVHASYGESFRAPGLTQLVSAGGSRLYIQNYYDPTVDAVVRGATLSGGNDGLKPETAKTYSLGIEYTPDSLPGSHFSLNYFDVTYEGQIGGQLANLNILRQESDFSSIILRDAAAQARTAELIAGGIEVRSGSQEEALNTPVFVDGRNNNLGSTLATGLDFAAIVPFETSAGNFRASVMGTWFNSYEVALTADAEPQEQVNNLDYPMRVRMRSSLSWENDGWNAAAFVNFMNSYNNPLTNDTIDSFTTVDTSFGYTFAEGLLANTGELKVGMFIRNAFDEEPPFADIAPTNNGGGGFDPQIASPVGRTISVTLSQTF